MATNVNTTVIVQFMPTLAVILTPETARVSPAGQEEAAIKV